MPSSRISSGSRASALRPRRAVGELAAYSAKVAGREVVGGPVDEVPGAVRPARGRLGASDARRDVVVGDERELRDHCSLARLRLPRARVVVAEDCAFDERASLLRRGQGQAFVELPRDRAPRGRLGLIDHSSSGVAEHIRVDLFGRAAADDDRPLAVDKDGACRAPLRRHLARLDEVGQPGGRRLGGHQCERRVRRRRSSDGDLHVGRDAIRAPAAVPSIRSRHGARGHRSTRDGRALVRSHGRRLRRRRAAGDCCRSS